MYGDLVVGCTVYGDLRRTYGVRQDRHSTEWTGESLAAFAQSTPSITEQPKSAVLASSKTAATQAQTEVGYVSGARMSG